MDLLRQLTERARAQALAAFAEANPGLYLYGRLPGAAAHGFKTPVVDPAAARPLSEESHGEPFLQRVEKSGRNAWARRITIGRAANNDVVLRHGSVSKLHAHLFTRVDGGALFLADDGSANGTAVNGRDLDRGDELAVMVSPGDQLRFGDVEATLLDPLTLHRELRRAEVSPRDF